MTDRMVDLVEEGFDLALRTGPLPDSTLIARRLGLGRKLLCASPDYLAHHGTPQHPADLAEHNCLTYINSFLEHHWHFTGPDGEHDVDVSGNLRTNSIEGMRAAALAGLGICMMPSMSIGADVVSGRLVRLLPEFRTTEAIIQAVYPASRHLSLKVRTFLDFLVERLACEEKAPSAARAVLLNGTPHGIAAQAASLRHGRA
jgi:DNA-binding transcriptional LysR family regulator